MTDRTDVCEYKTCSTDAAFAFYNPREGGTTLLCTDHLSDVDDFFDVRTWLTAGYAVSIDEWDGPGSLPLTPRREDQQRARQAVDRLIRGGGSGHRH
jgi:NAD(P)H-dependent FMN reductase